MGAKLSCPVGRTQRQWSEQENPTIPTYSLSTKESRKAATNLRGLKRNVKTIISDPNHETIVQMRDKLFKPKSFVINILKQKCMC